MPNQADAIIVLAGSYQERVPAAATLFRDGRATVIILANDGVRGGWSRLYQRNLYHIEWAVELLVESGVPRKQIVQLPFYESGTVYDALAVGRYVQMHELGSLLLVTSDYHARRALWTFQYVLKECSPELSVYVVRSNKSEAKNTALEYVKIAYYKFRLGMLGLLPKLGET